MEKTLKFVSHTLSGLSAFATDIKIIHSIFALPFVLATFVFIGFDWDLKKLGWIVLCMISARTFAMGMNRYLDREVDAANPRTINRMIPQGRLKAPVALLWTLLFGAAFCFLATQLNFLTAILSPLVLLVLGLYPLMKKFTWLAHWYLGACLGLSPIATSIAIKGVISLEVVLLGLAVMMWTAGFDILYALQDWQFDLQHNLRSIPARFGVTRSLWISRFSFAVMIFCLVIIGLKLVRGPVYFAGVFLIGLILVFEHWLVRKSSEEVLSSKINAAFFNANAWVSVLYYCFTQLDAFM